MYVIMRALHEFGAGRPSDYGYCDPDEDLALMVGYLRRRDGMTWQNGEEDKRKAEEERQKSRPRGKR